MTDALLTIDDIQLLVNAERREYVRDRIVKRPDFPRPAVFLSQKFRRWSADDVRQWITRNKQSMAR